MNRRSFIKGSAVFGGALAALASSLFAVSLATVRSTILQKPQLTRLSSVAAASILTAKLFI